MLETLSKSKLPRGWSYPVGAQVLSHYLEGIDGATERPLYFSDYSIRKSHDRHLRDKGEPYSIVEVTYSHPYTERNPEYLRWAVTIYPVPSDKAAAVRSCAVSAGLPQIREWLKQTRIVDAKQGRGFCRLLYHEAGERLLFQSRLNNTDDVAEIELPCSDHIKQPG